MVWQQTTLRDENGKLIEDSYRAQNGDEFRITGDGTRIEIRGRTMYVKFEGQDKYIKSSQTIRDDKHREENIANGVNNLKIQVNRNLTLAAIDRAEHSNDVSHEDATLLREAVKLNPLSILTEDGKLLLNDPHGTVDWVTIMAKAKIAAAAENLRAPVAGGGAFAKKQQNDRVAVAIANSGSLTPASGAQPAMPGNQAAARGAVVQRAPGGAVPGPAGLMNVGNNAPGGALAGPAQANPGQAQRVAEGPEAPAAGPVSFGEQPEAIVDLFRPKQSDHITPESVRTTVNQVQNLSVRRELLKQLSILGQPSATDQNLLSIDDIATAAAMAEQLEKSAVPPAAKAQIYQTILTAIGDAAKGDSKTIRGEFITAALMVHVAVNLEKITQNLDDKSAQGLKTKIMQILTGGGINEKFLRAVSNIIEVANAGQGTLFTKQLSAALAKKGADPVRVASQAQAALAVMKALEGAPQTQVRVEERLDAFAKNLTGYSSEGVQKQAGVLIGIISAIKPMEKISDAKIEAALKVELAKPAVDFVRLSTFAKAVSDIGLVTNGSMKGALLTKLEEAMGTVGAAGAIKKETPPPPTLEQVAALAKVAAKLENATSAIGLRSPQAAAAFAGIFESLVKEIKEGNTPLSQVTEHAGTFASLVGQLSGLIETVVKANPAQVNQLEGILKPPAGGSMDQNTLKGMIVGAAKLAYPDLAAKFDKIQAALPAQFEQLISDLPNLKPAEIQDRVSGLEKKADLITLIKSGTFNIKAGQPGKAGQPTGPLAGQPVQQPGPFKDQPVQPGRPGLSSLMPPFMPGATGASRPFEMPMPAIPGMSNDLRTKLDQARTNLADTGMSDLNNARNDVLVELVKAGASEDQIKQFASLPPASFMQEVAKFMLGSDDKLRTSLISQMRAVLVGGPNASRSLTNEAMLKILENPATPIEQVLNAAQNVLGPEGVKQIMSERQQTLSPAFRNFALLMTSLPARIMHQELSVTLGIMGDMLHKIDQTKNPVIFQQGLQIFNTVVDQLSKAQSNDSLKQVGAMLKQLDTFFTGVAALVGSPGSADRKDFDILAGAIRAMGMSVQGMTMGGVQQGIEMRPGFAQQGGVAAQPGFGQMGMGGPGMFAQNQGGGLFVQNRNNVGQPAGVGLGGAGLGGGGQGTTKTTTAEAKALIGRLANTDLKTQLLGMLKSGANLSKVMAIAEANFIFQMTPGAGGQEMKNAFNTQVQTDQAVNADDVKRMALEVVAGTFREGQVKPAVVGAPEAQKAVPGQSGPDSIQAFVQRFNDLLNAAGDAKINARDTGAVARAQQLISGVENYIKNNPKMTTGEAALVRIAAVNQGLKELAAHDYMSPTAMRMFASTWMNCSSCSDVAAKESPQQAAVIFADIAALCTRTNVGDIAGTKVNFLKDSATINFLADSRAKLSALVTQERLSPADAAIVSKALTSGDFASISRSFADSTISVTNLTNEFVLGQSRNPDQMMRLSAAVARTAGVDQDRVAEFVANHDFAGLTQALADRRIDSAIGRVSARLVTYAGSLLNDAHVPRDEAKTLISNYTAALQSQNPERIKATYADIVKVSGTANLPAPGSVLPQMESMPLASVLIGQSKIRAPSSASGPLNIFEVTASQPLGFAAFNVRDNIGGNAQAMMPAAMGRQPGAAQSGRGILLQLNKDWNDAIASGDTDKKAQIEYQFKQLVTPGAMQTGKISRQDAIQALREGQIDQRFFAMAVIVGTDAIGGKMRMSDAEAMSVAAFVATSSLSVSQITSAFAGASSTQDLMRSLAPVAGQAGRARGGLFNLPAGPVGAPPAPAAAPGAAPLQPGTGTPLVSNRTIDQKAAQGPEAAQANAIVTFARNYKGYQNVNLVTTFENGVKVTKIVDASSGQLFMFQCSGQIGGNGRSVHGFIAYDASGRAIKGGGTVLMNLPVQGVNGAEILTVNSRGQVKAASIMIDGQVRTLKREKDGNFYVQGKPIMVTNANLSVKNSASETVKLTSMEIRGINGAGQVFGVYNLQPGQGRILQKEMPSVPGGSGPP
jgi:hypothetical protein